MKKNRRNKTGRQMRNHLVKKFFVGLFSFLVIMFAVVAVIAYHRGIYDIVFIKRPVAAADETDTVTVQPEETTAALTDSDTSAPETDEVTAAPETETAVPETSAPETEETETTAPAESETSVPVIIDNRPPIQIVQNQPTHKSLIDSFVSDLEKTSALTESGYSITDLEYGDGFVLSLLETDHAIGSEYSLRTRNVQLPVRIPDEKYPTTYRTELITETEERPLIDIYMGYIIIDKGESCYLLKNDGTLITDDFDVEHYVPAYTRDKADNPIFTAEEPSRYYPSKTITYYYYINRKGELAISYDYDDKADNRGLYFNYPSYFGKSDSSYTVFYNEELELYGYGDSNGVADKESYLYTAAYNSSNGLCAAVEPDGMMYYFNRNLEPAFNTFGEFYKQYGNTQRRLYRYTILPDTFGTESIGFFYFDHGLCRVREQVVDAYHWLEKNNRRISEDNDILIRTDGTEFTLPPDYKLVAYSNGVLLLEKDGLYGYMDYTGKWIADPIYTFARPFNEGLAAVGTEGKVGIINTSGNLVVPQLFDYISEASGGVVAAYDEEYGWLLLNKLEAPDA